MNISVHGQDGHGSTCHPTNQALRGQRQEESEFQDCLNSIKEKIGAFYVMQI